MKQRICTALYLLIAVHKILHATPIDPLFPTNKPGEAYHWRRFFSDHRFHNAIGVIPVPGKNDIYLVWERDGRIFFKPKIGPPIKALDISQQTFAAGDMGLTNVIFHHDYPTKPYLYITYPYSLTSDEGRRNSVAQKNNRRLSRFTVNKDSIILPNSEKVLIGFDSQSTWHFGGGMFFHPKTKFLHLAFGDGGSPKSAQNLKKFQGKILRLDVDKQGGKISRPIAYKQEGTINQGYYIPVDNPSHKKNSFGEIVAIGLRSPWRMVYDSLLDDIFIIDVGETTKDELIQIDSKNTSLLNFGWPTWEGNVYKGGLNLLDGTQHFPPLSDLAGTFVGGFLYRGKKMVQLRDHFLAGKYWWYGIVGINLSKPKTLNQFALLPKNNDRIWSIMPDKDGEPIFITGRHDATKFGGGIYNLQQRTPKKNAFNLREVELADFTSVERIHQRGYKVLIPNDRKKSWDNGFHTNAYVLVPSTHDNLQKTAYLPPGSIIVKNYFSDINSLAPFKSEALIKQENKSYYGRHLRWKNEIHITEKSNSLLGKKNLDSCNSCHHYSAEFILGFKNLRPYSQTKSLSTLGTHTKSEIHESISDQFLSYIDINCTHCHNSKNISGWNRGTIEDIIKNPQMIGARRKVDGLSHFIVPGKPEDSLLYYRMKSKKIGIAMPPIGHFKPDRIGINLAKKWITSLESKSTKK